MATRKTSRTHAQSDVSRRAILDATLRIAAERGYVGTTVASVKKASGLPASSLYWHFKDKDELIAAALDHGFARWHEFSPRWERGIAGDSLASGLLSHFRTSTAGLEQEPGFWRMGLMLALETGPAVGSQARDRFITIRAGACDTLDTWWLDAVPSEHAPRLTRLTMAALDGLFVAHQSEGSAYLEQVLPMLAEGLARVAQRLADGSLTPGGGTRRPGPTARVVPHDPTSGRAKLLAAAAEVAAESGYEGATISRICARAGLPASSLYWHFRDKDDLLAAVVEHSYQEWAAHQPTWLTPPDGASWQQELRADLAVSLQSLQDVPTFLRLGHLLLLLRRDPPPAGRDRFVAVRRRHRLIMATWLREALGVPSELAERFAALVMLMSEGLFFSGQIDTPAWDAAEMADLLVATLTGALDTAAA